jgi:hypothetical protein
MKMMIKKMMIGVILEAEAGVAVAGAEMAEVEDSEAEAVVVEK